MTRRGRRLGWLAAGLAAVALLAVAASHASEEVGWRARLLAAKIGGGVPDIPIVDLVYWMRPGSPVYLRRLADVRNPHAAIGSSATAADAEEGQRVYRTHCASCHGEAGRGANAADLVAAVGVGSDWSFFAATRWGRPGTAMAAQPLDERAIWQVHAFVRQLALGADAPAPAGGAGSFKPAQAPTGFGATGADWPTYGGNLGGHRHSALRDITADNVGALQLAWTVQLRANATPMQATPLVADGRMYVTESHEGMVALDAASGERLWQFRRPLPADLDLCCGSPNRGAAMLGDTLFIGTLDAHLVAIDAATGRQKWVRQVAPARDGYAITGAPLAFGDRVVTGVSGSNFGIRGLLAAFAADDGRPLWRFHTIPAPGEPGHETWGGEAWKTGGGATWTVGAFDADSNTVIWGVGNPAPIFNGATRPGDNLYANSAIALDADTGRLRWHFQFVPHDQHDWDAAQQPVLTDIEWQGSRRPVVLWANRNAFFYALDRRDGRFLYGEPFAKQTWAEGLDSQGRPRRREEALPTLNGTLVWPMVAGATSWWPPALDPGRGLIFVPTVEAASIVFSGDRDFERGQPFLAGSSRYAANQRSWAGIKAIDIRNGRIRWQTAFREGDSVPRIVGGLLSTATGLLFSGYDDKLYALDADSGAKLWEIRLGARVSGSPVSYRVGERQYIAVAAGSSVFAFAAPLR